jgi:hypothetical protein
MSVNPLYPFLYSHGLRKPSAGFPAAIRASLTSEKIPDVSGHEADVPLIVPIM